MLSHPFSENFFKYVLKSISNKPLGIDRSVYQQQQQQQQHPGSLHTHCLSWPNAHFSTFVLSRPSIP